MTNRDTLVDARERELAANDLGNTYLVEAAAGTGKTTILVERIITIVRETLSPLSKVVAITFTEKAAGELKARVRKRLEEVIHEGNDPDQHCRKALRDLDAMPISTIHAFCRELLQQRPVEAEVDPAFGVMDESASRALQDEIWRDWLSVELEHDCAARVFLERGLGIESSARELSIRSLWDCLLSCRDFLDAIHVNARTAERLSSDVKRLISDISDALSVKSGCRSEDDALLTIIRGVERWMREHSEGGLESDWSWLIRCPKPNRGHKGLKGHWDPALRDRAIAFFLHDFYDSAKELERQINGHFAHQLIEWLKGAVRAYENIKKERGLLDFDDLLIQTRALLRDNPPVRDFFKARYDYILVDEFQDTDPLQTEIVFYLSEKAGRSAAAWTEVNIDEGKLFLVGDPKQSIYRFRRADLDLYGQVRERIAQNGECLPIRVNFRSRPELISEVNALFAALMIRSENDHYEPNYIPMEPYRAADATRPAAFFLSPPDSFDLTTGTERIVDGEASCIAEFIQQQVGSLIVEDKDSGPRSLTYRDIGILYPTTTRLSVLENALRARQLPFQTVGGRNLPARSEIIALRAVLNAIDNPYDEMSIVGALRSPFFGCSDEDLLTHRLSGGSFNYERESSADSPIHFALETLRELHLHRRRRTPSETLGLLLNLTPALLLFGMKPQGESRIANVLRVLDMARDQEKAGNASFHHLARWLDRLEELGTGEEDYFGDSSDDAVQLMTFHKSKGLEFPVVILFRLAQDTERVHSSILIHRAKGTLEFKGNNLETTGYAVRLEEERERQACENLRLLYVASTRARELLVIPAYWQSESKRGSALFFHTVLQSRYPAANGRSPRTEGTEFSPFSTDSFPLRSEPHDALILNADELPDPAIVEDARSERRLWEQKRAAALALLDRTDRFVRPSGHTAPDMTFAAAPSRLPQDAIRFGQFVHRLLQTVSLPDGDNLSDVAERYGSEFGQSEIRREEAVALVRDALQSPLFRDSIRNSAEVCRELNFSVTIDGRLIEGAMDLVYFENGDPVIVDFKTDGVTRPQARGRAEAYRRQAGIYTLALEKVLNRPVREVVLYFLQPRTTVTFPREDLMVRLDV